MPISKVNLAIIATLFGSIATIYYVHFDQKKQKLIMHEGVKRDRLRYKKKKKELELEDEFCEACEKIKKGKLDREKSKTIKEI